MLIFPVCIFDLPCIILNEENRLEALHIQDVDFLDEKLKEEIAASCIA